MSFACSFPYYFGGSAWWLEILDIITVQDEDSLEISWRAKHIPLSKSLLAW